MQSATLFKPSKLALACALVVSSQAVMAAAYKLPEVSLNGTALSAAYVANASGPDSSYYNPAAMVFSEDGASAIELDLTLVHLTSIDATVPHLGGTDSTKIENIPVPSFHYISEAMGDMRYGISAVVPGGLSKRWKGFGAWSAEEFTLKILEINPNISYKVSDQFAVGGGVRLLHSSGVVKSSSPLGGRDMEGDSIDFGYNLALHFKPSDDIDLAATYRSKVELTEKGKASLTSPSFPVPSYPTLAGAPSDSASVTVPLPAALSLAAAFAFDRTTLELVYERTFWSAYKNLDFDYSMPISAIDPGLGAAFDDPIEKDYKDTNTFRVGVTHQLDDKWTLMGGFAIDKTPVNNKYVGFELPDTDAKVISFGAKYKYSDNLTLGGAFLYDKKDKLILAAGDNDDFPLGAEFKNAEAYLVTFGMEYKF